MKLNVLLLDQESIFSQLQIEEALLRADDENWCIINIGSTPAIVMGISGKARKLIDPIRYQEYPIPIIRRFSGGGTVVVDENTLFISFIMAKKNLDFGIQPAEILQWTKEIYQPVFTPEPFSFTEHDYTIGERKVGGNAHYFTKDRWLHHTTFLWDYKDSLMSLLLMPEKRPRYRGVRNHNDFLDKLNRYYPSCAVLKERLLASLKSRFEVIIQSKTTTEKIQNFDHRKSVELVVYPLHTI